jgi:hypothetical protein
MRVREARRRNTIFSTGRLCLESFCGDFLELTTARALEHTNERLRRIHLEDD